MSMIAQIARWMGRNSPARFPYGARHSNSSTREHPWDHPRGRPYQIYGGPHAPESTRFTAQVWTHERSLEVYKLVEDDYSDRLYHVWQGTRV